MTPIVLLVAALFAGALLAWAFPQLVLTVLVSAGIICVAVGISYVRSH